MDIYKQISELQPQNGDLVVVPDNVEYVSDDDFYVHRMKFLNNPSIVKSRTTSMYAPNISLPGLPVGNTPGDISSWSKWFKSQPVFADWMSTLDRGFIPSHNPEAEKSLEALFSEKDSTIKVEFVKDETETYVPQKFFRHCRAVHFTTLRMGDFQEFGLSAKGGLTFFIELDAPNETFAFSYAICHPDDNFSKKAACAIAKQRFESEDWYEIKNYNGKIGVVESIRIALGNILDKKPSQDMLQCTFPLPEFSSFSERMSLQDLHRIYKGL